MKLNSSLLKITADDFETRFNDRSPYSNRFGPQNVYLNDLLYSVRFVVMHILNLYALVIVMFYTDL